MRAMPTHATVDMMGKKCAKAKEAAMQKVAPPMEPSHDFLGEMRLNSGCFPNKTPVQYAPVSFTQLNAKMDKGRMNWYCETDSHQLEWNANTLSKANGSAT